jgi:peptide/nickel transport system permease protein
MARYVIARLLSSVVLFFAMTLFVFVSFFVLPATTGGPRRTGAVAGNVIIRDTYYAHGSFPHQYSLFVWNFVRHGDLGRSYVNREAVTDKLRRAAPVTLSLVLGGVILWLLISIPLGVLSALRPRSLLDRGSTVFVTIGLSSHPVWLGLILAYFLGYRWHVVPVASYCDMIKPQTACGGPVQWAYHLLLPWLIFGLVNAALFTSMVRASVIEVLSEDYVRTARAKGASEARVVRGHVLRNVAMPLVTMIGMNVGLALGGVIFIESVFTLPGLGGMFRTALLQKDLPVTAGVVMVMTAAIMAMNLIVDLLYGVLDPRVRAQPSSRRRAVVASEDATKALPVELEQPA